MNPEQQMVKDFHNKFGFTVNNTPTLIDAELGQIRHYHTEKELEELEAAILDNDLVEIADALADLLYFVYGTGVAYGLDLETIFAEVHRSNMSKERPLGGGDRKAVKGNNYSPPDIESIISKGKRYPR